MKPHPFKTPDSYFDSLAENIEAQTTQKVHVLEVPALPAQQAARGLFVVPKNYFENLQHTILRKVNESKNKTSLPKYMPFIQNWQIASLAATFLLIISIGFWQNTTSKNKQLIATKNIEKTNIKPIPPTSQKITIAKENPPLPTPVVLPAPVALPTYPATTESSLNKYLETADDSTEEAIALLAQNGEAASEESEEDWHETNEVLLREVSEEEIASLPILFKK